MISSGISDFSAWAFQSSFDGAPGTSEYAVSIGKTTIGDELHIAVIDEDGLISGTVGTVLETFAFVSQGSDAKKNDGTSNFYVDVINAESEYIRWMDHDSSLTNAGSALSGLSSIAKPTSAMDDSLSGGTDDNSPTTGELALGYDLFEDSETVDVNLLFAVPDANGANTIANDLISIANARKDCMAFVSPPLEDTVGASTPAADVKTFADTLTSSSYASCDSGAVYVYDLSLIHI